MYGGHWKSYSAMIPAASGLSELVVGRNVAIFTQIIFTCDHSKTATEKWQTNSS